MNKPLCKIETCVNFACKTGLCSTHYKLRKTPQAEKVLQRKANNLPDRLSLHSVDCDGCRLWVGSAYPNGYGKINVNKASRLVHRVAFELSYGPIPPGLELHHLCENKLCINMAHLVLMTRKQHLETHNYPRDPASGRFIPHEN